MEVLEINLKFQATLYVLEINLKFQGYARHVSQPKFYLTNQKRRNTPPDDTSIQLRLKAEHTDPSHFSLEAGYAGLE